MIAVAEPVRVRPVPPVQAALRVGAVNDPMEAEADAVADRVLRMPAPAAAGALLQRCPGGCPGEEELRRQPIEEEDEELHRQPIEEEEEEVQASAVDGRTASTVPAGTAAGIDAARGGGSPLPAAVQDFFAPRLDADVSAVRIHTDVGAASLASSVNARAFTVGRDVFFGSGEYRPGTATGDRLLAHELTHTLQQRGEVVGRDADSKSVRSVPAADRGILQRQQATPSGIRNCPTEARSRKVHRAHDWALWIVDEVLRRLGDSAPAQPMMQHFPGTPRQQVVAAFERIQTRLGQGPHIARCAGITYTCTTDDAAACETIGSTELYSIFLKERFFEVTDLERAVIFVHEAAHSIGAEHVAGSPLMNAYAFERAARSVLGSTAEWVPVWDR